jgi:hypothetical protein
MELEQSCILVTLKIVTILHCDYSKKNKITTCCEAALESWARASRERGGGMVYGVWAWVTQRGGRSGLSHGIVCAHARLIGSRDTWSRITHGRPLLHAQPDFRNNY